MLARIGIKVTLNAQTRLKYFAEISNPDYHTSFYMLGWTPNTYDALNSFYNLAGSRSGTRGIFNEGGYSNPKFGHAAGPDRGRNRPRQAGCRDHRGV